MSTSTKFIECNDEGVHYIEARVNCLLQHIFNQPSIEFSKTLLPIPFDSGEATTGRVLLVKVNFFECGGMAIGVCISHKIADLSTLNTFMKSWAAMAREGEDISSQLVVLPEITSFASLFPPMDLPSVAIKRDFKVEKFPMRRFVFDASKISTLKAKAGCKLSSDPRHKKEAVFTRPTRVEAVTALIWKCARAAATSNRGGLTKPSAVAQMVNLRKRMNPPLPENSVGNLVSNFIAHAKTTIGSETELQGLIRQLRNGLIEFSENFGRKLQRSNAVSTIVETFETYSELMGKDEVDLYACSSWCRFDLYGVDFGWGSPKWVSLGSTAPPKFITLMDSSDGEGIEAWVSLNEAEMAFFQRNEELLQFASVNPSIII